MVTPKRPSSRICSTISVGERVRPLELGGDGDDLALHEAADGLDDLGPDVLVDRARCRAGQRLPHGDNHTLRYVLTLNLNSEKNVSPWQRASCIAGSSRRRSGSPIIRRVLAGDDRWTYGELDRAANALARHLVDRGVGRRRPRGGDDVEPARVRGDGPCGRASSAPPPVLLNPSWKALEVGTRARPDRAPLRRGRRCRRRACWPSASALTPCSISTTPACRGGARPHQQRAHRPRSPCARPTTPSWSSAPGRPDRPKAVRHTHGSIGLGTAHWVAALGLGHDDRFQVATPPSHILGLLNLLAAAAAGATVRLHRRFDLDEELALDRRTERMTLEMAVAPIALAMANHPDLEAYDLSSLRYIMWGATPVTPSVAERVTARTGRALAARLRGQRGAGDRRQPGRRSGQRGASIRPDCPVGDVALRVVDLDTGAVLAPGRIGEVQVRSASAMAGYLPDEATADAFDDGWYRTGDVGWLEPEGWVHLTDRCKEMIKVSGFQVAPAEIEAVLHGHPAVVDCAVFGVADERAGEVPVAAVQLEPGCRRHRGRAAAPRGRLARHLQASCAMSSSSTPSPGRRRARCCAARCATSGPRRFAAAEARLMDVRLSPEQVALRDSAAQVVDRLGSTRGGATSTTPSGRPSSTPPSTRRAGASCGRPTDDGTPVGLGGRGGHRRRGARPGPGRRRLPRPDPGRGAPPAGRAPPAAEPRDGRPDRRPRQAATAERGTACHPERWPSTRTGAVAALVLVAGRRTATRSARPRSSGRDRRVDLTRPVVAWPSRRRPVTAVGGQSRSLDADDLVDVDAASASP